MFKKAILETLTAALLIGMAGDLLYLYCVGAWYDPYLIIEIVEIVILIGAIGFGIWRVIYFIRGAKREVIKMPACECLATCPYFNDSTYGMPEIFKDWYCRGDYRWCGRYMAFKAEEQKRRAS